MKLKIFDKKAMLLSFLISSLIFLACFLLFFPKTYSSSPQIILNYLASIFMSERVLPPEIPLGSASIYVGLFTHFIVSFSLTAIISFIFYKGGILEGILGGAFCGFCFYLICVYGISLYRPWFYIFQGIPFLVGNIAYGALSGFLYELFEEEEFEIIQSRKGTQLL